LIIIKIHIFSLIIITLFLTSCSKNASVDITESSSEAYSSEISQESTVTQPSTEKNSSEQTSQPATEELTTEELTTEENTTQYSSAAVSEAVYIWSDKPNTCIGWSFKRNSTHLPTLGYNRNVNLSLYNAYYLGDTSEKTIYLTFDEGYEYGFTPAILDTLKENDVKACFFLTKAFIKSQPELAKRIKEEGHVAGNHTVTHPSLPSKNDEDIVYELEETARYYKEMTGYDMDMFLRPPMGEFSERTLDISNKLGYKTIFWSLAYKDYDVNNQPGKEYAYKHVMDNYHPGGIFLLHAVSQSNTEALDDIIKGLKAEGYTFKSLYDLPEYENISQ